MKILITGNKGFVASYLKEALEKKFPDAQILGFDKEEYFSEYRTSNLKFYLRHEYDYVFHLAAIARTAECTDDPYERSLESNVMLTKMLLSDFKFKKFIYASSCAIYGDQNGQPITESSFANPPSIYASQKLFSENLVHLSLQNRNIPSVCLRLFNTYGPKQSVLGSYPNVLASMIRTFKKEGIVEVTGDGNQTRNFVYVDDVVEAFIAAMKIESGNHIYNVASDSELSIGGLAFLVAKDEKKIIHIPDRPFDIKYQHRVSAEKIQKELGWKATVNVFDGVEKVLQYEGLK